MGSQVKLTDAEKTRRLAEGCMGWEVFPLDRDGYSGAPRPKLIEQITGVHPKQWAVFRKDGKSELWDPLTDEAHAAEVREAMRAKGWSIYQGAIPVEHLPHSASVFKVGGLYVSTRAQLSTAALCHAALLALGLAKEEEL